MPRCYVTIYGRTNGFRLFVSKAHFARLRFWEAAVDSNGPCVAFLSKGGCGSMTWQMDSIDSPGGLPSNIFPVNWKASGYLFGSSDKFDDPPFSVPPFLFHFTEAHTQETPTFHLSLSPTAVWKWTGALSVPSEAWTINYKQPCQRRKERLEACALMHGVRNKTQSWILLLMKTWIDLMYRTPNALVKCISADAVCL